MHYFSEFIACLIILAVTEGVRHEIRFFLGEDAVLSCAAKTKPDVQYRSVTWYKVSEEPSQQLSGLVRKRLTENSGDVKKYKGVQRDVRLFESSMSLLLSNVTAEDSGIYKCFLTAPLGHQNQEGVIVLKVDEHATAEKMEFNKSDSLYVVLAVTVLIMALLMFCISYVCLRNVFQSNKKLSALQHQGKNVINTNHLICKTMPEVYV
ncbi:putative butyrophilin subfamily 2 member A3 [Carassius carassius]|uniref:putative butyrophilin subfamily 2 member A3 n=1 Tax=Carassius carassius TaxID=217509 RepID=UPI002868A4CD|nr:putative butyrophilin subfamily 2 member A3 [Carassius carassius]